MSSRSVTPARRRRAEETDLDEPADEGQLSVPQHHRSKRVRRASQTNNDENNSDVSESSERPVLPDNYRRSPRGKQRATSPAQSSSASSDFQPGSIVRVELKTFVTYTEADFYPGPNLNMVIGPNGTGKSTLVCGICLGLGGSPNNLGRAKEVGEFVKHGAKKASIEIELAKDPARQRENPVIRCEILKEGNKTKFSINGKKSTRKDVQRLVSSFSIQVDNLCQFLPQDRVVEFAALSPEELLVQTQRAAAPEEMSEWHEQLKNMRKDEKQRQTERQSLTEQLRSLEDRQKSQEGDVERLRERAQYLEKAVILEKLKPFPELNKAKREHSEAKQRKQEARKELNSLRQRIEPNEREIRQTDEYLKSIQNTLDSQRRLLRVKESDSANCKKQYAEVMKDVEDQITEINVEKSSSKKSKQLIPRQQQEIDKLQQVIDMPPPEFDFSQVNADLQQGRNEKREIDSQIEDLKNENFTIINKANQKRLATEQLREQRTSLQSQVGRQENKLSRVSKDAAVAWKWIQENRGRFRGKVHGPPMIECSVKSARDADFVETVLNQSDIVAFTVTSNEDFQMLTHQLYTNMGLTAVNVRSITRTVSDFKAPMTADQLRTLGFEGWILDLIDGPEAVLAMLCDNARIQQTAFTKSRQSDTQYEAVLRTNLISWVAGDAFYQVVRRREYGDHSSNRVRAVKSARLLTDAPVDAQVESSIERQVRDGEAEYDQLKAQVEENKAKIHKLEEDKKQVERKMKQSLDVKNERQSRQAQYNALPAKLDSAQRRLEDLRNQVAGSQEKVLRMESTIDKLYLKKGQSAIDYALALDHLQELHVNIFNAEIMEIEAHSDLEQMRIRHHADDDLKSELETKLQELEQLAQESLTHARGLHRQCEALSRTLEDEEKEIHEAVRNWEPDRMENEIQSNQAQLDMLHGGNENLIREYEQRERKIEERRNRLHELEASLANVSQEIAHVRGLWEPRLDELVQKISTAFADNFARISCVGEVAVRKKDDFDQWAIEIRVKFREHEQLSVLDSHRQSGGERAVSTIFYLMALQCLARAPFRVVDEINQGMDPRNERLVHSRMVDIACAEQTSQYFLVTPKLLTGLKYHPKMKVHCIASGEHMPEDHRELNFGVLAKRALNIRAAQATS